MRKVVLTLIAANLFFAGTISVRAQSQSAARVSLYALQTDDFPIVSVGFDVLDAAGNPVAGLSPEAITLLEDDQARPVNTLEQLPMGVHFALALDPGTAFSFRDVSAVSRYDKIEQILSEWASTHPDDLGDDLSLVPTQGTVSVHLATGAEFLEVLRAYSPSLQTITPSLDTLAAALDAVSELSAPPETKRAVLFVSSPPAAEALATLQSLTQRAVEQHIRVYTWIVASSDAFSAAGATALKDLAIQTGGQYAAFSGVEPLPGLEAYLAPLRSTYRLTYTSGLRTSGTHTLAVQVNLNGETLSSGQVNFDLNIQPPNPVLVSPPDQIVRQAPDVHTSDVKLFLPALQPIEIIVEFPDGHPRSLVSTALYIDNQKVAENTAAPFDRFTWDLSGYDASGQHVLQVEAVDDLGLSKTSLGVPVTVTIVRPQRGLLMLLSRNSRWVVLAAILFAGVALGAILIRSWVKRRAQPASRKALSDPLTQPVHTGAPKSSPRPRSGRKARQSEAYLARLKADGAAMDAAPIPVVTPEMTFGSDPMQATRILDDPSVAPLHARLKYEKGEYILSDEKSVAGTWVNYESITAPRNLRHGDVLQIGRYTYRFMLSKPPERPAPKIAPIKK